MGARMSRSRVCKEVLWFLSATVGDKVRVLPNKVGQPPRDGEVTGLSGSLLRVRWSTGEETSFVPGAGSVEILGKAKAKSTSKKNPAKKATRRPKT